MGQHSQKPFPSGRRRWTAIAAGAAVIATASTTAWAALADDDSPTTARGSIGKSTESTGEPATSNEAALQAAPKTHSPAPAPPAGANPKPTKLAVPSTKSPQPAIKAETRPTTSPRQSAEAEPQPAKSPQRSAKAETEATKPKVRVLSSGACGASFYDEPQMTASGERFNPSAMTAAHKTLPLGSKVRVTNPNTGESVTVRINDRGPYAGGRCLDLSAAAFAAIGNTSAGVMRVKYEVLAR